MTTVYCIIQDTDSRTGSPLKKVFKTQKAARTFAEAFALSIGGMEKEDADWWTSDNGNVFVQTCTVEK